MWKNLMFYVFSLFQGSDPGRVLGYQVSIDPNELVQNVTETTFLLVVKEGNYSATVRAFNAAGFGPATRLQIDTQDQNCEYFTA